MSWGVGGVTSDGEYSVASDGVITRVSGTTENAFEFTLRASRDGVAGESLLLSRLMYAADGIEGNAVQVGNTAQALLDDLKIKIPFSVRVPFSPAVGSIMWVDLFRDESEHNSGGIAAIQPTGTLSGLNPVASASLQISKIVV